MQKNFQKWQPTTSIPEADQIFEDYDDDGIDKLSLSSLNELTRQRNSISRKERIIHQQSGMYDLRKGVPDIQDIYNAVVAILWYYRYGGNRFADKGFENTKKSISNLILGKGPTLFDEKFSFPGQHIHTHGKGKAIAEGFITTGQLKETYEFARVNHMPKEVIESVNAMAKGAHVVTHGLSLAFMVILTPVLAYGEHCMNKNKRALLKEIYENKNTIKRYTCTCKLCLPSLSLIIGKLKIPVINYIPIIATGKSLGEKAKELWKGKSLKAAEQLLESARTKGTCMPSYDQHSLTPIVTKCGCPMAISIIAALFEEFYPGSCFAGTIAAISCDGFGPAETLKKDPVNNSV